MNKQHVFVLGFFAGFLTLTALGTGLARASDSFNISLSSTEGATVAQGDETKLSALATVQNIDGTIPSSTKYSSECSYDGTVVFTDGPKKITATSTLKCGNYDPGQLLTAATHPYVMNIYEVAASGARTLVTSQTLSLVVQADTVAPVWSVTSPSLPLQSLYVTTLPHFSATLADSFGYLDKTSIVIQVDGVDVTSQLNLSSPCSV